MSDNLARRRFFKQIISSVSEMAGRVISSEYEADDRPLQKSCEIHIPPEIMADLTPELLALEAERLGLDPKKDHHRIIESIQAAMGGPDKAG